MQLRMHSFERARVLVVGDVMLDRYWYGPSTRISPEAPVPVVNVTQTEDARAARLTWHSTWQHWAAR